MPRPPSVPKPYVKSGQLAVNLRDPRTGYRRTIYLGDPGDSASRKQYARVIADWEAADRAVEPPRTRVRRKVRRPDGVSVTEIVVGYWMAVKARHTDPQSGQPTPHGRAVKTALRRLRQTHGNMSAIDFGPLAFQDWREHAIKQGDWNRQSLNRAAGIVQRCFRWAVSRELVPSSVYESLKCVEPLKPREDPRVREPKRVGPVGDADVDAIRPHVARQVWAIVELQRLTGARGCELTIMRPCDLDTSGAVWFYTPEHHKNTHRRHQRVIPLEPKAQQVVAPFLSRRKVTAYMFSPSEAEAERLERRAAERVTATSCGNTRGSNRKPNPKRTAGDHYTSESYGRAVQRGCDAAAPVPDEVKAKGEDSVKQWRKRHRWTPYQQRHSTATRIRKQFGLVAASLVLGHSSTTVTDAVYAQHDTAAIEKVMLDVG